MPEKHLYEYAVIRIVPKVEREEFINVGVILFSKQADICVSDLLHLSIFYAATEYFY